MNPLERRLSEALRQQRDSGLERRLRVPPPGAIDLASNDYLGLARHPAVIEASAEAAARYGAGARASRLVSGHSALHEELEQALAAFKGCGAALIFPSGYMANLAVINALAGSGDLILCDKRNHASLIDACRLAGAGGALVRYYGTVDKLSALLENLTPKLASGGHAFIVSDGVYSMDGDLCDLPALMQLSGEFGATIILDDAHGTGTLGEAGRGVVEHFGMMPGDLFAQQERVVQLGTLSKALGSQGGFVAGPRWLMDWFINAGRPFIYTTALNPASCAAALAALKLIDGRNDLMNRLDLVKNRLAQGLSDAGYSVRPQPSPVLPVMVGEAEEALTLSERLRERGVWCPAIRPPTVPHGGSRLRATASAGHSDADLDKALRAFRALRR